MKSSEGDFSEDNIANIFIFFCESEGEGNFGGFQLYSSTQYKLGKRTKEGKRRRKQNTGNSRKRAT